MLLLQSSKEKKKFAAATAQEESPVVPPAMKILVVDDVMSNRKLLKRLLERCGHRCDEAENGKECVEMVLLAAIQNRSYDSVLLDFEMPIMNGPTAAKEIRKNGFKKLNIVGITGNVLPEDVKYFKSCGANDVRAKPVKIADINKSWMEFFSSSSHQDQEQETNNRPSSSNFFDDSSSRTENNTCDMNVREKL